MEDIHILDNRLDEISFVHLLASAEKFSEHPLAKAVLAFSQKLGIAARDPEAFEMRPGKGVIATVDGQRVLVGDKILNEQKVYRSPEAAAVMERMQKEGKTVLPVALEDRIVGVVSIADQLRKEARKTIARLKKAAIPRIVLLTGDNQASADAIGQSAGVTDILASQLPEDKVNAIKGFADKGSSVGMVGRRRQRRPGPGRRLGGAL